MSWDLRVTRRALKDLRSLPAKERSRIDPAFDEILKNPYSGDHRWLRGALKGSLRRRVGDWRILFRIDPETEIIFVLRVVRRTTTTYKGT